MVEVMILRYLYQGVEFTTLVVEYLATRLDNDHRFAAEYQHH